MAYPSDLTRTKDWGTEILYDTDLEGQFDLIINWLSAFAHESTGHTHTGAENRGPKITLTTGSDIGVTGTLAIANGGTGATTQQAAMNALAGAVTNNRLLRANGTNIVLEQATLTTDVTGTLPVANGGTGQTTSQAAIDALVPTQTGNNGKYFTTDGINVSWGTVTIPTQYLNLISTTTLTGQTYTTPTIATNKNYLVVFNLTCGVSSAWNMAGKQMTTGNTTSLTGFINIGKSDGTNQHFMGNTSQGAFFQVTTAATSFQIDANGSTLTGTVKLYEIIQ